MPYLAQSLSCGIKHVLQHWLHKDAGGRYNILFYSALVQLETTGEGEDEGVDEGVDAAGEQGEARRRGAPLAGMANSSPVETPSGSPATSCGRV